MKKKILSMALAAVMAVSASAMVVAEGNNPSVYVDDALISFNDQAAVITQDRTLIPARGVFEAMEAKVDWDEATRTVTIVDRKNITYINLVIDNPVMKVTTFKSLLDSDTKEVTLDVAPQILNDRTMIPLRAVSEALNAKVDWDQAAYRVDITTTDKPSADKVLPTLSLSASKTAAAAGDEVDVYVNLKNIVSEKWVSAVSAVIEYDKTNFTYVRAALCKADGSELESSLSADNSEFSDNAVKIVAVTIDSENAVSTDGCVMKVTFKSLNGKEGSFNLSNGYDTVVGYNTDIILDSGDGESAVTYEGNSLRIDKTPVVIGASDASVPEVTAAPQTTAAPEATEEPAATAAPEATEKPEATAAPKA